MPDLSNMEFKEFDLKAFETKMNIVIRQDLDFVNDNCIG